MGKSLLRPLYTNLTLIVPDRRGGGGDVMTTPQLRMSSSS